MGIGDLNDKGPEFPVPFLKGGKGMDRKYMEIPVVKQIAEAEEVGWVNPKWRPWNEAKDSLGISMEDIDDAEARLLRFAPFIISEPDVWRSDSGTSPTKAGQPPGSGWLCEGKGRDIRSAEAYGRPGFGSRAYHA